MAKDTRIGQSGCRTKRTALSAEAQAVRIIESIRARRRAGDHVVVLADYHPTSAIWTELARQIKSASEYTDLIG